MGDDGKDWLQDVGACFGVGSKKLISMALQLPQKRNQLAIIR
jgi:hypothetical protein